jgi:hypothetical protein
MQNCPKLNNYSRICLPVAIRLKKEGGKKIG